MSMQYGARSSPPYAPAANELPLGLKCSGRLSLTASCATSDGPASLYSCSAATLRCACGIWKRSNAPLLQVTARTISSKLSTTTMSGWSAADKVRSCVSSGRCARDCKRGRTSAFAAQDENVVVREVVAGEARARVLRDERVLEPHSAEPVDVAGDVELPDLQERKSISTMFQRESSKRRRKKTHRDLARLVLLPVSGHKLGELVSERADSAILVLTARHGS